MYRVVFPKCIQFSPMSGGSLCKKGKKLASTTFATGFANPVTFLTLKLGPDFD